PGSYRRNGAVDPPPRDCGQRSAGVLHLGPELEDRLGVHLADPRLGDAQDLTDLGQGEALVVVSDHDLLALTEPVDRADQDALHLLELEVGHRSSAPLSSSVSTRLRRSPCSEPPERGIQSIARSSSMIAPLNSSHSRSTDDGSSKAPLWPGAIVSAVPASIAPPPLPS